MNSQYGINSNPPKGAEEGIEEQIRDVLIRIADTCGPETGEYCIDSSEGQQHCFDPRRNVGG